MNLPQILTFLEVARTKSFRRAAEALNLTQPAVSAQIRALEGELGTPLFHRPRVCLTAAGEAYLPFARQIADLAGDGRQAARDTAGLERGRITLGASPCAATAVLPRLVHYFRDGRPGILVTVHTLPGDRLAEGLREGGLDAAVHYGEWTASPGSEGRWTRHLLFTDTPALIVPGDHPAAREAYFPLGRLAETPLISLNPASPEREVMDRLLAERGVSPTVAVELSSVEEVKRMVREGVGIALVPRISLDPEADRGIRVMRVPGLQAQIPVVLCLPARRYRSRLMERFLADLRGIYPPEAD